MFMRVMTGRKQSQRDAEQRFDAWLAEGDHVRGHDDMGPRLPCHVQTPELVAGWMLDHGAPGVIVVVRHVQRGLYEYLLDEVRRIDLRLKRIYLVDHGVFRLNGDDPAPPGGRYGLLAPVGDVLDAAVGGHTWLNGRPAFRRPHSSRERLLANAARRQREEAD